MNLSEPSSMEIKTFDNDSNLKILKAATINFIKQNQRFERTLYWANEICICELELWSKSWISFFKTYLTKYFIFSPTVY